MELLFEFPFEFAPDSPPETGVVCAARSELTVAAVSSDVAVGATAVLLRVRERVVTASSSTEVVSSSPPEPAAEVIAALPVRVALADRKVVVAGEISKFVIVPPPPEQTSPISQQPFSIQRFPARQ